MLPMFPTKKIEIEPIGIINSCFTEKFGIPRQPNLAPAVLAFIEIFSPYNKDSAFTKIDTFSHIWLTFYFHQSVKRGWRDTVRPPRLGGNKKVGVFASRSPQRPNFLGHSVVKFEKIIKRNKKLILVVSGVDILNNTPILDIKPYIPYSDKIEATEGYASSPKKFPVHFDPPAALFCKSFQETTGENLQKIITQLLSLDPRPAYQVSKEKVYGMSLFNANIKFYFKNNIFHVRNIDYKI